MIVWIVLGIVVLWVVASVPLGLLVGKFIAVGQHRQDPLAREQIDRMAA